MDYPKSDPSALLHNDKFTDGDPANGIPASRDRAAHQNMVFDELINAITALGGAPDETKADQLGTLLANHGHDGFVSKSVTDALAVRLDAQEALTVGEAFADESGWAVIGEIDTPQGRKPLIRQWGRLTNVSLNQTFHQVSFAIAFPNTCLDVDPKFALANTINGNVTPVHRNVTTTGFQVAGDYDDAAPTGDIKYDALGW